MNEVTEKTQRRVSVRNIAVSAPIKRAREGPKWIADCRQRIALVPWPAWVIRAKDVAYNYGKFVGPGIMVSIAYMDPGNYSTDVSAGASQEFSLLFVILLSNIIAMFLQSLAIKLGCVTGNDLAVACKNNLPKWITICLYILAEIAIIATDIAEVIGTAIALNILLRIPLIAGVAITVVDVMLVLLAYRPGRGMKAVRAFEHGVSLLVLGIVICFAVELARIPKQSVGHVLKGYLPSHSVLQGDGMYLSCGILGATVMPHSLYLGSALVRPRLRDYDIDQGLISGDEEDDAVTNDKYRPSIGAIRYVMGYSIAEVVVSLCTMALFVNSAILIVAGATMYNEPGATDADLYSIHDMLSRLLSGVAGTIFMLALLFSGQSAGIICTIAGQIVCEGHLNWTVKPWIRRMVTRLIAIVPCLAVVGAVGKTGLSQTLNASQVALSILLPFLTAPLIYLTCCKKVMTVTVNETDEEGGLRTVNMANGWIVRIFGIAIWLFIALLNVYLIVHLAMFGQ
ncbi:manganese transporter Smf1p [Trichomonascus vanleenenianus]|uniref:NRAMP family metal ion transporter n=1 Tax=Trichomonascus vanleenenianus TaxID=2268995 RepID=UPI003EC98913